jgi:hypothetical protein
LLFVELFMLLGLIFELSDLSLFSCSCLACVVFQSPPLVCCPSRHPGLSRPPTVHRIDFLGLGFLFVLHGENSLSFALSSSPFRVRSGHIRFGFPARSFFESHVILVDFPTACMVARFHFPRFGFRSRGKQQLALRILKFLIFTAAAQSPHQSMLARSCLWFSLCSSRAQSSLCSLSLSVANQICGNRSPFPLSAM